MKNFQYFMLLMICILLVGCLQMTPLTRLQVEVDTNDNGNQLIVPTKLKSNEGLLYVSVNSEIQNNTITFINLETREQFRTGLLEGRYHRMIVKLPAGKYAWKSIKLNRSLFGPDSAESADFEVLAGRMNYPGDIDITIYSRERQIARVTYVDRENSLPPIFVELENYEFHYAKLSTDEQ